VPIPPKHNETCQTHSPRALNFKVVGKSPHSQSPSHHSRYMRVWKAEGRPTSIPWIELIELLCPVRSWRSIRETLIWRSFQSLKSVFAGMAGLKNTGVTTQWASTKAMLAVRSITWFCSRVPYWTARLASQEIWYRSKTAWPKPSVPQAAADPQHGALLRALT